MYFSIFTKDRYAVDVIGRDTRYALSGFKHYLNDLGYPLGSIFGSRSILQDRLHGRTVIYVPFNLSVLLNYLYRFSFPDHFIFACYALPLLDSISLFMCDYLHRHYADPYLFEDLADLLGCDVSDFIFEEIYMKNFDLLEGYVPDPFWANFVFCLGSDDLESEVIADVEQDSDRS